MLLDFDGTVAKPSPGFGGASLRLAAEELVSYLGVENPGKRDKIVNEAFGYSGGETEALLVWRLLNNISGQFRPEEHTAALDLFCQWRHEIILHKADRWEEERIPYIPDQLYPGARIFLQKLREIGLPVGWLTGNPEIILRDRMRFMAEKDRQLLYSLNWIKGGGWYGDSPCLEREFRRRFAEADPLSIDNGLRRATLWREAMIWGKTLGMTPFYFGDSSQEFFEGQRFAAWENIEDPQIQIFIVRREFQRLGQTRVRPSEKLAVISSLVDPMVMDFLKEGQLRQAESTQARRSLERFR